MAAVISQSFLNSSRGIKHAPISLINMISSKVRGIFFFDVCFWALVDEMGPDKHVVVFEAQHVSLAHVHLRAFANVVLFTVRTAAVIRGVVALGLPVASRVLGTIPSALRTITPILRTKASTLTLSTALRTISAVLRHAAITSVIRICITSTLRLTPIISYMWGRRRWSLEPLLSWTSIATLLRILSIRASLIRHTAISSILSP